jgi:hypothetical protein
MPRHKGRAHGVLGGHSLSLTLAAVIVLLLVLYARADRSTRLGSFYGNAIADWLGTLLLVIATKYFYEVGSSESRAPHPRGRGTFMRVVIDHSLTILLVATGVAWVFSYAMMDPDGKAGAVVGNIVSEWTQVLGIVVMTKYARESGSKK